MINNFLEGVPTDIESYGLIDYSAASVTPSDTDVFTAPAGQARLGLPVAIEVERLGGELT